MSIYIYICKTYIVHLFFSHVFNNTLFFKVLECNPEIDSSRIRNCDESGFPTDPLKGCVIAKKVSENKARQIFYFFQLEYRFYKLILVFVKRRYLIKLCRY